MNKFLNLLQFLTRITIKKDLKMIDDMGDALVFFPLVGVIIGILMYIIYYIFNFFYGSYMYLVASIIIVLFEAIITGGLHIDGFGDTFDGIFSYRPKEKILEIMKDPTMGTNGVLAIVFLILFKVILIYMLLDNDMAIFIFQAPIVGRLMPVLLSYKTKSARENGMGELFIGKIREIDLVISTLYTLFFIVFSTYLFIGLNHLIYVISLFAISIVIIEFFKREVYKKLNGLTGDILGCSVELAEVIYIIGAIFLLIGR